MALFTQGQTNATSLKSGKAGWERAEPSHYDAPLGMIVKHQTAERTSDATDIESEAIMANRQRKLSVSNIRYVNSCEGTGAPSALLAKSGEWYPDFMPPFYADNTLHAGDGEVNSGHFTLFQPVSSSMKELFRNGSEATVDLTFETSRERFIDSSVTLMCPAVGSLGNPMPPTVILNYRHDR